MAFKTLPNLTPILQAHLIYLWSHPPHHKHVPPYTYLHPTTAVSWQFSKLACALSHHWLWFKSCPRPHPWTPFLFLSVWHNSIYILKSPPGIFPTLWRLSQLPPSQKKMRPLFWGPHAWLISMWPHLHIPLWSPKSFFSVSPYRNTGLVAKAVLMMTIIWGSPLILHLAFYISPGL